MENKTVIIAAGGTGGHLYPGIALARELSGRGYVPIFVVKENDIGSSIISSEGFSYKQIPATGLPRKISLKIFLFIYNFVKGLFNAFFIVKKAQPIVVIGMGGYISFPVLVAGIILRKKTIIHEQNSIPGLANKILSYCVNNVALSYAQSAKYFPNGKSTLTGNPVRKEIINADKNESLQVFGLSKDKFTILVFGGSQGASKINSTLIEAMDKLVEFKDEIQFLHITGKANYEATSLKYAKQPFTYALYPYLENMACAYAASDMVLCRAGATTLAELALLALPSVLVPFAYATNNHQQKNAELYSKNYQAQIIQEKYLTPELLAEKILSFYSIHGNKQNNRKVTSKWPQEKLADLIVNFQTK